MNCEICGVNSNIRDVNDEACEVNSENSDNILDVINDDLCDDNVGGEWICQCV